MVICNCTYHHGEAIPLKKRAGESTIPPTYLQSLRHHLEKRGRSNVNERDKRLLQYIRVLQELKRKQGITRLP
ncbi:MAG: hypothetical protein K6T66_05325 [Peptococcaceae bacterium]|nr:hypothetical protein [Peptococcaceae bacterium]